MTLPRPPWYAKLDAALEPAQGLVDLLLLALAVVSLLLLFSRNNPLRTAWVVYMISP